MQPARPTPPAGPVSGRPHRARAIQVAGIAVAALAIGFCVKALVDEWPEVRTALARANAALLVTALGCSAVAMIGLGLLWWRSLRLFGSPVRPRAALAWYFGGELGKYLPGGVWSVLGRGELARRNGRISRGTAYATTLICYGAMSVAAAVVCGVLAPIAAADRRGLGWGWALLALVPLGLATAHPRVFGRLLVAARRVSRGRVDLGPPPSWTAMVRLILWSVPTWLLVGGAAVLVTESLGLPQHPARVAFAAVAAWIIGFLAVPVPAGAGVREVVFVVLCGLHSGPGIAVAAIARLLLLLVDGLGGAAGLGYVRARVADESR